MWINDDEKMCGNCAHWDTEGSSIEIPNSNSAWRHMQAIEYRRCLSKDASADLSDVTGVMPMTHADVQCPNGECFVPSDAFLAEKREEEEEKQWLDANRYPRIPSWELASTRTWGMR